MRVCLLGELTVSDAGVFARRRDFPTRQTRLVAAYLATHHDRVVSRAELAEVLWPATVPDGWSNDVSAVVSKVRAALRAAGLDSEAALPTSSGGYRLLLGVSGSVDVDEARNALGEARHLLAVDRPLEALAASDAAIGLLRAGFLPLERGPWVEARRDATRQLLADALALAADAAVVVPDPALALVRATELIELEPHHERSERSLMRAQLKGGDRGLAIATYERCRLRLRDELGVLPSEATEAVYLEALGVAEPVPDLALPAPFTPRPSELPFVGRRVEVRRLEAALSRLDHGPHLAVVRGEAGIGKTRLVRELARRAHGGGALVLSGRCDDELRVPFAAIAEALEPIVTSGSPEWLAAICGTGAADLSRILPSISTRLPDIHPMVPATPDLERLRLLDAVRVMLGRISRDRPVILAVDDLHWTDPSTLMLVRHLMQAPSDLALLVVATVRDGESTKAIDDLVADLAVEDRSTTIRLTGLAEADIAKLVGDRQRADSLRRATGGNPLFVRELIRADTDGVGLDDLPDTVIDVITRRVRRLTSDCQEMLLSAAVAGERFELASVAAAVGADLAAATASTDEAIRHGIVVAPALDAPGMVEFVHPLVRHALLESMSAARLGLLHHLVGAAIAQHHRDEDDFATELHRHFRRSSDPDDRPRAVAAARRAAAHAAANMGFDESLAYASDALALFEQTSGPDREHATLLVELAEAQRRAGDTANQTSFRRAVVMARAAHAPDALARAALGLCDPWTISGLVVADRLLLLEEALDLLDNDEPVQRSRLTSQLASEQYYVDDSAQRRRELSDAAVALARETHDQLAVASALHARAYATWGLGGAERRLAAGREVVALADGHDSELTTAGLAWLITANVELGEIGAARHAVDRYRRLAEQLRQPRHLWYALTRQAMLDVLVGDDDHALETIARARDVGRGEADESAVHQAVLAPITIRRGNTDDLPALIAHADDTAHQLGNANPSTRYVTAVAAAAAAEWDQPEQANALLDRLPRDWILGDDLVSAATLALVTIAVTHTERMELAQAIHERLSPLCGTHLVAAGAVTYWGAASHWLGVLAALLGDRVAASQLLHQALDEHRHVGSRPFTARTRTAIAQLRPAP